MQFRWLGRPIHRQAFGEIDGAVAAKIYRGIKLQAGAVGGCFLMLDKKKPSASVNTSVTPMPPTARMAARMNQCFLVMVEI